MRDIKGYEGQYAVTSCGKVWSHKKQKFIAQSDNGSGYLYVCLSKNSIVKHYYVHRLVAEAYISNPDKLPQVNHKDECKTNNCISNLEWCTNIYNQEYGTRKTRQTKKVSKGVYCLEVDRTFYSINEAARQLDVSPGYISYALTHSNKSKGYHFNYLTNEIP